MLKTCIDVYFHTGKDWDIHMLFSKQDLRKLIIPLIFEQALAVTVGMADTMMISSVGESAVSGVSLVDMINMLIFSILSALATGGAVVTSQNLGAKKIDEACRSAKQLLLSVTITSIVITLMVIWGRTPLLTLFFGRIEADVMRNALIYLMISAVSFPFLAIYNACSALFRSMGNAQITLKVSIFVNLINVIGNAICIFILHMGVAGVAIPTLISRAIGGIILYVLLKNPENVVHFRKEPLHFEWNVIRKILYIGIPSGIENGIFQLGRVLVVSIISGFGTVQIAANGVANNLDTMGCIVGQAISLAMITVIGQCVGANDEKQVRYYTKRLLLIAYVSTAFTNCLILLFLNPILSLYGLSAETTRLAYILVMIHDGCAILLWPVSFILPNMLRACNDVKFTMIVSIFSMFAFRIGLSYVIGIQMEMGAIGVWIAMLVDWMFRTILFIGRYASRRWKKYCHLA